MTNDWLVGLGPYYAVEPMEYKEHFNLKRETNSEPLEFQASVQTIQIQVSGQITITLIVSCDKYPGIKKMKKEETPTKKMKRYLDERHT